MNLNAETCVLEPFIKPVFLQLLGFLLLEEFILFFNKYDITWEFHEWCCDLVVIDDHCIVMVSKSLVWDSGNTSCKSVLV